jgi:hypothetical protein
MHVVPNAKTGTHTGERQGMPGVPSEQKPCLSGGETCTMAQSTGTTFRRKRCGISLR